MTDRIRVDEIPGGVWKRAPLISPEGYPATAHHDAPKRWAFWSGTKVRPLTPDWHVCLNDSLGLAGLAARVAQRLGLTLGLSTSIMSLADTLSQRPWASREWRLTRGRTPWKGIVIEAAQYLALTDRLCAAVGLERKGAEVAKWECLLEGGYGGYPSWRLSLSNVERVYVPARGPHSNWLPALRAALASVEAS